MTSQDSVLYRQKFRVGGLGEAEEKGVTALYLCAAVKEPAAVGWRGELHRRVWGYPILDTDTSDSCQWLHCREWQSPAAKILEPQLNCVEKNHKIIWGHREKSKKQQCSHQSH